MAFLNTLKKKLQKLNKKVKNPQETISFSDTGVQIKASMDKAIECVDDKRQNLVVASNESRFSDDMISYAIEMAHLMDYGIIAVNVANLTHEVTEFFSTTQKKLYDDFRETSIRNVESFRRMAADQGLEFAHTTKFSNIDHAIDDITKQCGEIAFIISENRETTKARGLVANEKRLAQQLYVYSMN